jgi:hypothetical protein
MDSGPKNLYGKDCLSFVCVVTTHPVHANSWPFMRESKPPMSPLDFQRLVDGELSHAQRAELLRCLGDDVQPWRSLAMALLEEQQWSREVCSSKTYARIAGDAVATVPIADASVSTLSQGYGAGPESAFNRHSKRSWNWMSALAASALFALGLFGGTWMRSSFSPLPNGSVTGDTVADVPSSPSRASRSTATDRSFASDNHLVMDMPGSGMQQNDIPLVDARDVDPQLIMAKEAYEMARWNQQLKKRGYQVDVQPEFYSGSLDDGRRVIVPVHNVSLKPYGL